MFFLEEVPKTAGRADGSAKIAFLGSFPENRLKTMEIVLRVWSLTLYKNLVVYLLLVFSPFTFSLADVDDITNDLNYLSNCNCVWTLIPWLVPLPTTSTVFLAFILSITGPVHAFGYA
jgi:hypothetical protein